MFITFEGIEGSGKSTQIELWKSYFESQGKAVVCTKEPGGTPFGVKIREILLDPQTELKDPRVELLLFTADRLEHIQSVIKPALTLGKIVLCDRYLDSTYAYQLAGRKNTPELVDTLCQLIPLVPDRTILLDLPVEEGLKRAKRRAALDRFEKETLNFHYAIREGYLTLAKNNPDRITVIDCNSKSPQEVFESTKQMGL